VPVSLWRRSEACRRTVDYYRINMKDRIVLSNNFTAKR
jgi:hypothetical protein